THTPPRSCARGGCLVFWHFVLGSVLQDQQLTSRVQSICMGGLIQPTPIAAEPDSSRRTIAIAVAVVIVIALVASFLLRGKPKGASGPPPYAASLKLSDFKMSAAENFVGATVSYVDGTITNTGTRTITHIVVEVTFKDELGQLA